MLYKPESSKKIRNTQSERSDTENKYIAKISDINNNKLPKITVIKEVVESQFKKRHEEFIKEIQLKKKKKSEEQEQLK